MIAREGVSRGGNRGEGWWLPGRLGLEEAGRKGKPVVRKSAPSTPREPLQNPLPCLEVLRNVPGVGSLSGPGQDWPGPAE